ncbi:MAG: lipocalin family protein [Bacteroidota bacterium]
MKILKILFLAVLTAAFVGCSDDDDGGNPVGGAADLVGTWNGTGVSYSGTTETTANGVTISADFVGEGYDYNYTVTFSENPNQVTSEGSYSIELTTTSGGQTITQNVENISFSEVGEWSISGDQLTVTSATGDPSTATIVELTANSLILNIVDVQTQNAGGTSVTSTTDSTFTFSK